MKTKYFIYHIPGVKIGVSNNPEYRVVTKQGFAEYEILEEHTNVKVVSKREQELQAQYGYPVDKIEYWKTLRWQKKDLTKTAQEKRVKNTNFKESRSKIDHKSSRAKAVANTDYKARNSKIDWELRTNKLKKPVNQYDLEGNFIKRWDSAIDASKLFSKNSSNITRCLKGELKHAYKFIWKYAN
jgi:hypothetical protein